MNRGAGKGREQGTQKETEFKTISAVSAVRTTASVAELADAPGLGPGVLRDVEVRILSLAILHLLKPTDSVFLTRIYTVIRYFGFAAFTGMTVRRHCEEACPERSRTGGNLLAFVITLLQNPPRVQIPVHR